LIEEWGVEGKVAGDETEDCESVECLFGETCGSGDVVVGSDCEFEDYLLKLRWKIAEAQALVGSLHCQWVS
jgi:hypothetical protein